MARRHSRPARRTQAGIDVTPLAVTADFWHAPHAIRCMEAGLHVYCESMMAHTLDAARAIVRASERTGKLCQIGHQHRRAARSIDIAVIA